MSDKDSVVNHVKYGSQRRSCAAKFAKLSTTLLQEPFFVAVLCGLVFLGSIFLSLILEINLTRGWHVNVHKCPVS